MDIGFIITTYKDLEAAIHCLTIIRQIYPNTPITSIADGYIEPNYQSFCTANNINLILGTRLKVNSTAGIWIKRWMLSAISLGTKYVIKIDPDTRLIRKIRHIPEYDIFGHLNHATHIDKPIIESNSLGITHEALNKILSSSLLEQDQYINMSPEYAPRTQKERIIMTDWILYDVIARLELSIGEWTEVQCSNKPIPINDLKDIALTHPYNWDYYEKYI